MPRGPDISSPPRSPAQALALRFGRWLLLLALAGLPGGTSLKLCAAETPPVVRAGTSIVPPLTGPAATNQLRLLERLRHLPRTTAFAPRTFQETGGKKESLRYLLFKPTNAPPDAALPLVLSLHGGAPRKKFEHLLEPYAPGFAYGLGRLVSDETQREHPCYVVAPWSDNRSWDDGNLRLVLGLLDALQKEFKIDPKRIYVTGQSMGGFGTWSIITQHPERFAAAVPVCGGGEPGDAARARNIPIWALHGSSDTVVPVGYTRRMIQALQKSGASPVYWEYRDATHAQTAERAYCEPELIRWLFAQRRP